MELTTELCFEAGCSYGHHKLYKSLFYSVIQAKLKFDTLLLNLCAILKLLPCEILQLLQPSFPPLSPSKSSLKNVSHSYSS